MQQYRNSVRTLYGRAVPGASITVRRSDGSLATIYNDNGITPRGNPFAAGQDGEYSFYAENGRYSITVVAAGYATETIADVLLHDPKDVHVFVEDFGAKGDNVTDSTTAIRNAYAALVAKGGGTLHFGMGRFIVTGELNFYRASSTKIPLVIKGSDQLTTTIVAGFYGAGSAVFKFQNGTTTRCAATSVMDLGFACQSTSGGINPVFIDGFLGESNLDRVKCGSSNNTHVRLWSTQNLRSTGLKSFYGGRHFNYKSTAGLLFDVETTGKTITCTNGTPFSASDVGKYFFIFPSDPTRRIRYTISSYVSPTQVVYSNATGLTQTGAFGHFEPARAAMTSGSNVLTANSNCFTSDMVGLVVYVRRARAGSFGDGLLRGQITSYLAPNQVTLDQSCSNTITDEFFAVATLDMGQVPGTAASSDVKIDKLHIEHYDGVALICQNTNSYNIAGKLHGETRSSDHAKSMSAMWLDDVGGDFEIDLDSSCTMADSRIYASNFNDCVRLHNVDTRGVIHGEVIRTERFTDPGGYLVVENVNSTIDFPSPESMFIDGNAVVDPTDPRLVMTGFWNMLGDSQKGRVYVGRSYFMPDGTFVPAQRLGDSAFTGTIAWDGTAPSNPTSLRYRWERVGSLVRADFRLEYGTPGATNTVVTLTLPTSMPAPVFMSGTGTNELVAVPITGHIATAPSGAVPALVKAYVVRSGSDTQLKVTLNSGSVSAGYAAFSVTYWAAA